MTNKESEIVLPFDISCSQVLLGSELYQIGTFVGEDQISSILARQHDDQKGLKVFLFLDNGQPLMLIHRGTYTLFVA